MADQDFLSYSTVYETFSKGPKSIYYGIGDEMLPGAILNVPQTDEDDEWGRTQRITDERTYDFLAKVYKTLFDPYNAIADVSFVPGEAGSEINVAKNMIRLVGRTGIDTGVFNLTDQTMVLGEDDTIVAIDGPGNSIIIGNGFEATPTTVTISSKLLLEGSFDPYTASIGYIGSNSTLRVRAKLFDNGVDNPTFTINVKEVNYIFDPDKLSLQNANVSGTLTVTTINSTNTTSTNVYATTVTSTYLFPTVAGTDLRIGRNAPITDTININAKVFNLYTYAYDVPMPSITVAEDVYNIWNIDLGTKDCTHYTNINGRLNVFTARLPDTLVFSVGTYVWANVDIMPGISEGVSLGNSVSRFNSLWVKGGNVSGDLTTQNILPASTGDYNIGSDDLRYKKIYTNSVTAYTGLYSDNDGYWTICGPELRLRSSGSLAAKFNDTVVRFYRPLETESLYPTSSIGLYIGSICGGYEAIYLRDRATGDPRMIYLCGGNVLVA